MRQIFHDWDLQNEFLNKGFITMPLLSEKEVEYLLSGLKNLQPDDHFDPNEGTGMGMTFHATLLDTNADYRRKADDLIREVFSPHIERLLTYEVLVCNFFVKPPEKGVLKFHQNWSFLEDTDDTTLTIWCPLVDANEKNGTLQILEGSHKLVPHVITVNTPEYFDNFIGLIEEHSTPVPLKAGHAIVFDDSLLHGSGQNDSSSPRCAVQIVCVPKDVEKVAYRILSESTFEMFEMDSNFFIDHTPMDLAMGEVKAKNLGAVENRNHALSDAEFVKLLKNGDEIRQNIYFPKEAKQSGFLGSLLDSVKGIFG
jgi:hypothetical protein